jgi:hypothetical protein
VSLCREGYARGTEISMASYNDILADVIATIEFRKSRRGGVLSDKEINAIGSTDFYKRVLTGPSLGWAATSIRFDPARGHITLGGPSRLGYLLQAFLQYVPGAGAAIAGLMQANNNQSAASARVAAEFNQIPVSLGADPLQQFRQMVSKSAVLLGISDPKAYVGASGTGESVFTDGATRADVSSISSAAYTQLLNQYYQAYVRAFQPGMTTKDSFVQLLSEAGLQAPPKKGQAASDKARTIFSLPSSAPPPIVTPVETAPAPAALPPGFSPPTPAGGKRSVRRCSPDEQTKKTIQLDDNGVPEVVEMEADGSNPRYLEGTAAEKLAAIKKGSKGKKKLVYAFPCTGRDPDASAAYAMLVEMTQPKAPEPKSALDWF